MTLATSDLATNVVELYTAADLRADFPSLDRVGRVLSGLEAVSRNEQVETAADARFQVYALLQAANILHSPTDPAARDDILAEIRIAGMSLIRYVEKSIGLLTSPSLESHYLSDEEVAECPLSRSLLG